MISIACYQPEHLPQLQALINTHMGALVPGWALPEAAIASRLQRNPGEYVVDPWVAERVTLCAIERQRVVAAAHLLRYGSGSEVGAGYHNLSEIAWFLAWPEASTAAAALLKATRGQIERWGVAQGWALETCLPAGPFAGVPDAWPHIAAALAIAGYSLDSREAREEALYAGYLGQIPEPAAPPIAGLSIRRTTGRFGAHFVASLGEQAVGDCDCVSDLTDGGALPALYGWGELAELEVREPWRGRGIGTWLAQHAAAWMRLGGCSRIILSVAAEDETAGAGRFYQQLGWNPLSRFQRGWVMAQAVDQI
ncbi:MAG TPA: GNAT family N-acetyltransferase [Roseiflexaceae bacterium]|nr:GNAT family N-acetyltransferase [Roseiflexaceae bacterium]